MYRVMVLNATFNNISVISWHSFIGKGNQSTQRKSSACCKSLTNYYIMLYWVNLTMSEIRTHNVSGDRWLVYGGQHRFQQYFSYIVAVTFIGGGNWRKPPTCRKSLTLYHIMLFWVHLSMNGVRTKLLVVIDTDCTGSCKSNYHMIMTTIFWNVLNLIL
jgi:hypothetical protein